ncbi:fimbrial protein [Yersinia enterocolitica]|nr:hypothetical protein [Yersinia enterocolitica]ELI7924975.1 fimbrial protein [Yersinia enterocolitica]
MSSNKISFFLIKKNRVATLIFTFLAISFPLEAFSRCYGPDDSVDVNNLIINADINAPVGTVLATASGVRTSSGWWCDGAWNFITTPNTPLSPYGNNVAITNIPGVGMRYSTDINGSGNYQSIISIPFPAGDSNKITSLNYLIELIKIGNITPGVYPAQMELGRSFVTEPVTGSPLVLIHFVFLSATVTNYGCSVLQPSIDVTMGDVQRNSFSGVGSVSESIPFSVQLNCQANTQVDITINAEQDSSNIPGVIRLNQSAETTATGIGVQMLYNNNPMIFGSQVNTGTSAIEGNYSIPFTARYLQIQPVVTAGHANASATFTMSYR